MNKEANTTEVFICHASKDKSIVVKVASILKKVGIGVWLDDWEIVWGDSIVEKINRGLESNRYLMVFLSTNSISSTWVQRELNSALMAQLYNKHIRILPVKLDECEIPPLLRDFKWISLSRPESYHSAFKMMFQTFLTDLKYEHAILRIDALLKEMPTRQPLDSNVFVSCPNCGGHAMKTNIEKKDHFPEIVYFKSIQCEQCGMLFLGQECKSCSVCGSIMLWNFIGRSEGICFDEDDYAWECLKCENYSFSHPPGQL